MITSYSDWALDWQQNVSMLQTTQRIWLSCLDSLAGWVTFRLWRNTSVIISNLEAYQCHLESFSCCFLPVSSAPVFPQGCYCGPTHDQRWIINPEISSSESLFRSRFDCDVTGGEVTEPGVCNLGNWKISDSSFFIYCGFRLWSMVSLLRFVSLSFSSSVMLDKSGIPWKNCVIFYCLVIVIQSDLVYLETF